MRLGIPIAAALLVATACSPDASPETTVPTDPEPTTTSTAPTAGTDPCIAGGLPFATDGLVATVGEAESDATRIGGIVWQPSATCERLIVEFTTDTGSPASSLGLSGVSVLSGTGILRIALADRVTGTAVADLTTNGDLIDRIFVVRDVDGSLFIDIVGAAGVAVGSRAFLQASPARLIVDLIADADAPVPVGAAVSDTAVIPSPLPGPALYPLTVEAYAQPSLRSVRLLVISNDTITIDRTIAIEGASDAWQTISSRLDDGPSGTATVFVGTADANGRPADGATVLVDLP